MRIKILLYREKYELKLAFLPQPMAAPSLLKKEIVQIPLKDEIPERQICLVYDSQHPMGAAARELKNTILFELSYIKSMVKAE